MSIGPIVLDSSWREVFSPGSGIWPQEWYFAPESGIWLLRVGFDLKLWYVWVGFDSGSEWYNSIKSTDTWVLKWYFMKYPECNPTSHCWGGKCQEIFPWDTLYSGHTRRYFNLKYTSLPSVSGCYGLYNNQSWILLIFDIWEWDLTWNFDRHERNLTLKVV